jgi:hypothetical protein
VTGGGQQSRSVAANPAYTDEPDPHRAAAMISGSGSRVSVGKSMRHSTSSWIAAMAKAVARALASTPSAPLAQYEVLLAAARDPRLRGLATAWRTAHLRVVEGGLRAAGSRDPERHAQILAATVTGLGLSQLAAPRPHFEHDVLRPAISELVAALTAPDRPRTARDHRSGAPHPAPQQ